MPKKKKPPLESEKKNCPIDSDNYLKNDKYVKKLKLQRTVLNKLIGTGKNLPSAIQLIIDKDPDSE
jgi:hypothetical protein